MLRKPCGGMNPAVDVSWHPNHFLSDRIMSPLCSALSWPRASRWCSKTLWMAVYCERGLDRRVHGKRTQWHGVHEFRMILSSSDWCGTVCSRRWCRTGRGALSDCPRLSCWLLNCMFMSWSAYQLGLYPLPIPTYWWSLKAACCYLITLNIR